MERRLSPWLRPFVRFVNRNFAANVGGLLGGHFQALQQVSDTVSGTVSSSTSTVSGTEVATSVPVVGGTTTAVKAVSGSVMNRREGEAGTGRPREGEGEDVAAKNELEEAAVAGPFGLVWK